MNQDLQNIKYLRIFFSSKANFEKGLFVLSLIFSFYYPRLEGCTLSSHGSLHEVATLGAPTTGALIEGSVGSLHKGCRHRFYCHSADQQGFLGSQTIAKPLSLKDQPGIFPAPLMGPASLTFNFSCQHPSASLTPVVVRPDGTVFQGSLMTNLNSPQTLVISSPAQSGIYTLFVLAHHKDSQGAEITVDASISTQPQQGKIFNLKSFNPDHENQDDFSLISAEFIYTPLL